MSPIYRRDVALPNLGVLIALWNMRRWAVLAQLVFAAYTLLVLRTIHGGLPPSMTLWTIVSIRGLLLIAGAIHWKRMEW